MSHSQDLTKKFGKLEINTIEASNITLSDTANVDTLSATNTSTETLAVSDTATIDTLSATDTSTETLAVSSGASIQSLFVGHRSTSGNTTTDDDDFIVNATGAHTITLHAAENGKILIITNSHDSTITVNGVDIEADSAAIFVRAGDAWFSVKTTPDGV